MGRACLILFLCLLAVAPAAGATVLDPAPRWRTLDPQVGMGARGGYVVWRDDDAVRLLALTRDGRMRAPARTIGSTRHLTFPPQLSVDSTGGGAVSWVRSTQVQRSRICCQR